MKKNLTKKTSLLFLVAIFILACLPAAACSDSFVDEIILNTMNHDKPGQSLDVTDRAVPPDTLQNSFEGDSFVDAKLIEATDGYRFGYSGQPDPAEQVISKPETRSLISHGDSFVDAEVLERLDGFVFFKEMDSKPAKVVGKK